MVSLTPYSPGAAAHLYLGSSGAQGAGWRGGGRAWGATSEPTEGPLTRSRAKQRLLQRAPQLTKPISMRGKSEGIPNWEELERLASTVCVHPLPQPGPAGPWSGFSTSVDWTVTTSGRLYTTMSYCKIHPCAEMRCDSRDFHSSALVWVFRVTQMPHHMLTDSNQASSDESGWSLPYLGYNIFIYAT